MYKSVYTQERMNRQSHLFVTKFSFYLSPLLRTLRLASSDHHLFSKGNPGFKILYITYHHQNMKFWILHFFFFNSILIFLCFIKIYIFFTFNLLIYILIMSWKFCHFKNNMLAMIPNNDRKPKANKKVFNKKNRFGFFWSLTSFFNFEITKVKHSKSLILANSIKFFLTSFHPPQNLHHGYALHITYIYLLVWIYTKIRFTSPVKNIVLWYRLFLLVRIKVQMQIYVVI